MKLLRSLRSWLGARRIEKRTFRTEDICRIYGVPLELGQYVVPRSSSCAAMYREDQYTESGIRAAWKRSRPSWWRRVLRRKEKAA